MDNAIDTANNAAELILSALSALLSVLITIIRAFRRVIVGLPGAVWEHPWIMLVILGAIKLVKTLS